AALPGLSPPGRATVLTVERCAEEWWRASDVRQRNERVLSLPELRGAHEAAAASFDRKLGEAGPAGAMLRSLHWAGWTSPSATSFRSPSAGVISALETSPRQLGRIFKLDALAQIELRADEAIRRRFNLGADFGGIWWEGAQAALKGSYCSALERHVIVSLLGGTYLTGERARDLSYLVDGSCAACGVPDTVAHRVGCCPHFAAGRAAETGWHGDLEAGRSLCDTVLLDLCLPSPPPRLPEPPRGEMRAFIGEREVPVKDFVVVPGEKIAGDGSCSTSPLTSLVRAGWGVVQWDAVQGVLRMIIGSIHAGMPQSADQAYAGLVKQKSHVHVVEQPASEAEWAAWLNDQADKAAKLGARLHGTSTSLVADLEDRLARMKQFLRGVARVLCTGPTPKQEWADLRRPPASRVAAAMIAHEFVVVG
ncbi:unnamed protein product, partial [Prorocentrum cordatum]